MNTILSAWLVSLMTAVSPPDRMGPAYPGWAETPEERLTRYEAMASDLTTVVEEEAPLFAGSKGRSRTAALLLATAFHESGFAKDVDVGPCYRGPEGRSTRCDGGSSYCVLQLKIGKGSTHEGWSGDDLFSDRQKCFRAGLHLMRRSFTACTRTFPQTPSLWLSAYAGGVCERFIANRRSREIWTLYEKMTANTVPVFEAQS